MRAVLGAGGLRFDGDSGEVSIAGEEGRPDRPLRAGDLLSIHGQSGEVFLGAPGVAGALAGASLTEAAARQAADEPQGPA